MTNSIKTSPIRPTHTAKMLPSLSDTISEIAETEPADPPNIDTEAYFHERSEHLAANPTDHKTMPMALIEFNPTFIMNVNQPLQWV